MNGKKTVTAKLLSITKGTLWAMACVVFFLACAAPPSADPQSPKAVGPPIATGCDCKTAPTAVLGIGQTDWPQDSKSQADLWEWWKDAMPEKIKEGQGRDVDSSQWCQLGPFTNSYNCAGYIYADSSVWVDAVGTDDDYLGTTSGCWQKDPNGTIRIDEVKFHVCRADYIGKAGHGPLQNYNDDLYGPMDDRYSKVP